MKIAFFTNCYKPLINGVVSSIVSLKDAYEKKGHQTYIFAPKMEGYQDREKNVFRYHSVNLTKKVKYPIAIPLSLKATRVINDFRPDVIHLHHPFVLSMPAIMYAAKLKIPKILTIHTQYERYAYYVSPIPRIITNEAIRRIIFHLANKVDVITTPSQSMKDFISRYGVKKKIVVIPNAIDLSLFQEKKDDYAEKLKSQIGLQENDVVLLYVGRISFEKNIDKIIKAMEILRQKNIVNVKLLLVGDGNATKKTHEMVHSLKLKEMVKFIGMVDNEIVKYYYSLSDVFVFASTSETFGMVIIEAFASGVPVLAVKAPGVVDIVSDGLDGILVEEDVVQFAEHLEMLVKDKDLRFKLSQGALNTAKKYSVDNVSDQMLALYQSLGKRNKVD